MIRPKVHNVLLAVNEADASAAIRRDPTMANWSALVEYFDRHPA